MLCTGPEGRVPPATAAFRGARLRRAGANGGEGREMTFEEAAKELEGIVERLERGDAGVDELTKLWERGEELYKICAEKLEGVQGKIEELARSTQTEAE